MVVHPPTPGTGCRGMYDHLSGSFIRVSIGDAFGLWLYPVAAIVFALSVLWLFFRSV
jgi:hypothetical protein